MQTQRGTFMYRSLDEVYDRAKDQKGRIFLSANPCNIARSDAFGQGLRCEAAKDRGRDKKRDKKIEGGGVLRVSPSCHFHYCTDTAMSSRSTNRSVLTRATRTTHRRVIGNGFQSKKRKKQRKRRKIEGERGQAVAAAAETLFTLSFPGRRSFDGFQRARTRRTRSTIRAS